MSNPSFYICHLLIIKHEHINAVKNSTLLSMCLRSEIFLFAIFFIFKELQRKTKWKFDTIVFFYLLDDLVCYDGLLSANRIEVSFYICASISYDILLQFSNFLHFCLVLLRRRALTFFRDCCISFGTIQSDLPLDPLKIKEKNYSTDSPPSDIPTNTVKLYQARLLHCQHNIHACWSSATLCKKVAMSLQLQHICLLAYCKCHKHHCCLNMPTGWVLLQDGCLLDCSHSISMPADLFHSILMSAGVVLLYLLYLLVWFLTISHACWCGASLYAMPSGVVPHCQPWLHLRCLIIWHAFWYGASLSAMPVGVVIGHAFWWIASLYAMPSVVVHHYRSCLLEWYLTICHVCWCGTSLSFMNNGVVLHYRLCLLVWYLTIDHACWSVATAINILLVDCADERRIVTSLVLPVHRCHYIRHVCWSGATVRYACLYSATLSDMHHLVR